MSNDVKPLDLEAIEAVLGALDRSTWAPARGLDMALATVPALIAEVRRLRAALEGLVEINSDDFPLGSDGKINWSAYPVTFRYAAVYRAALVALGREKP